MGCVWLKKHLENEQKYGIFIVENLSEKGKLAVMLGRKATVPRRKPRGGCVAKEETKL